jgi:small subunit ribosomal protein S1
LAEETIEGWLTDSYDYERPRRGQVREGVILRVERQGVIVDVGLKREGIVPHKDLERLGKTASSDLKPGQEVAAYILRPEDRDGNLVLSLFRARLAEDWDRAKAMLESGEVWRGKITGYNKGGLTVGFGRLDGFVPGSHLWAREKRRLSSDQREELFKAYIGQELPLKVIEVDRGRRRLILSERLARQALRKRRREDLLGELLEGQVVQGTVSRLCDFGAFVDVGGADGLVHISELAWRRVSHPREVLQVGDEIDVYVLRLDHKRKRIGLSLKRTQPDPWSWVELTYEEGQLVSGVVTGVADFGAFAGLEIGVEGLIHVSELADPPPEDPRTIVKKGDELVLRILRIEPSRRRIALSLNRVSPEERDEWLQRADADQPDAAAAEGDVVAVDDAAAVEEVPASVDVPLVEDEEAPLELVAVMEGMTSGEPQEM